MHSVDRNTSFLFVGDVMLIMRSGLGLLRQICTVGLHVTLPRHRVVEPTHIGRRGFDLVLTDVPDVAGVWVGSLVGTANQRAFLDIVLEQHNLHFGRKSISRIL